MALQHDGRRVVLAGGFVVAELGTVVTALAIWFLAAFHLSADPLGHDAYLQIATGLGLMSGLLVLGVLAMRPFAPPTAVATLGLVLAAASAVGAVLAAIQAGAAPAGRTGDSWWWPYAVLLLCPTTWPMLVVIAAGSLRGLSRREPRSRPAR